MNEKKAEQRSMCMVHNQVRRVAHPPSQQPNQARKAIRSWHWYVQVSTASLPPCQGAQRLEEVTLASRKPTATVRNATGT